MTRRKTFQNIILARVVASVLWFLFLLGFVGAVGNRALGGVFLGRNGGRNCNRVPVRVILITNCRVKSIRRKKCRLLINLHLSLFTLKISTLTRINRRKDDD